MKFPEMQGSYQIRHHKTNKIVPMTGPRLHSRNKRLVLCTREKDYAKTDLDLAHTQKR